MDDPTLNRSVREAVPLTDGRPPRLEHDTG